MGDSDWTGLQYFYLLNLATLGTACKCSKQWEWGWGGLTCVFKDSEHLPRKDFVLWWQGFRRWCHLHRKTSSFALKLKWLLLSRYTIIKMTRKVEVSFGLWEAPLTFCYWQSLTLWLPSEEPFPRTKSWVSFRDQDIHPALPIITAVSLAI